ncbi:MAG: response regulator [Actinobacteria bacterium]|nr:response regulator [Actinomycetota bacterium]
MTHRILVVEDHKLVSRGLEMMLSMVEGFESAGVVHSGEDAVEAVKHGVVDVVLMDVSLGEGIDGVEATRRIKEASPDTKILMLTMFTDPGTVTDAVKAGADGYLSKGASEAALTDAIRQILEGRAVLDPRVTQGVFGRLTDKDPTALTDRELDVLRQISQGQSTKEVAAHLYLSEETIKTHLKNIFRKLGVHDRAEAVAEAFRRGVVR